jgi:voltage-gated sodium channel
VTATAGFRRGVVLLILGNALLLGLLTFPQLRERWGAGLAAVSALIQVLFVAEIGVRLGAHGRRPGAFFRDGWNLFDFTVVALSLLPAAGPFATVARLARILRVARLVSSVPDLRLIVGTMLRSIPSIGHVLVLLSLLLFVWAVVGVELFGAADPVRWGHLGLAVETLFQVLTLEGWAEIHGEVRPGRPWAFLFFSSFIFTAVFVVVNLFVAVMLDNLEKVRAEEDRGSPGAAGELRRRLAEARAALERVEAAVERIPTGAAPRPAGRGAAGAETIDSGGGAGGPRPDPIRSEEVVR